MASSPLFTLYHASGMGSMFTLALLRILSVPHRVINVEIDFNADGIEFKTEGSKQIYEKMKADNPLAQFPTLICHLEKGDVIMTEMAGIALYLLDKHAEGTPWSPAVLTDAEKALFYRLMIFIPANIYPPITVMDFPARFVAVPPTSPIPAAEVVQWVKDQGVKNHNIAFMTLESILVSTSTSVFALGTSHPTIVDIYISLVAHYHPRPRPAWLRENCPNIYACAKETLKHPVLRKTFLEQDLDIQLAKVEE